VITSARLLLLVALALVACDCSSTPEAPCRADQIAAGFTTTWVLTSDQQAWRWGAWQLPTPADVQPFLRPSRVDWLLPGTVQLGARNGLLCFLSANAELRCSYTLGQPTSETPVIRDVSLVALGTSVGGPELSLDGCVLKKDGSVWCWAKPADEVRPEDLAEQEPLGRDNVTIAVGGYQKCAVKTDGALWCWGAGILGDNTPEHATNQPPRQIPLPKPVMSVAAATRSTCAVTIDGAVICWGDEGGLPVLTPTLIDIVGVKALTMGHDHACALKQDGTVWCWGNDNYGQLGFSRPHPESPWAEPGIVAGIGNDVTLVVAGYDHTCARRSDASVWCWGSSRAGQAGTEEIQNPTPAPIRGCR
jgi:alpha-tubulin suppressor-like RCC1 family protein